MRVIGAAASIGLVAMSLAIAQPETPRPGGGGGGRPGQTPEQVVDRVMQNDADGDGKVSKAEAAGKPIERLFGTLDADSDGFATRDEIKAWAERQPAGGPGAGGGGPAADLPSAMRQAGRSLRALRGSALDASTLEQDLQSVNTIQGAMVTAKGDAARYPMAPAAKAKYGNDQAAYVRDMRLSLLDGIDQCSKLERALLSGNAGDAKAARTGLIQQMEKAHELFQPPEDEGRGRGPGGPGGGR